MIELQGKFNFAKVFTDNPDEVTIGQIIELCNQEFTQGSKIRIMPDTHAGAGCVIGTTMTITDKIVPNLVGVDIGCGMEVVQVDITRDQINFDKLDEVIRKYVPSGFSIRSKAHPNIKLIELDKVRTPIFKRDHVEKSLGTLGGGNHFIELNEDEDGKIYIVIHSGSRNLGKQIAEHYQNEAYKQLINVEDLKEQIIKELKEQGREKEIHEALRNVKKPKIKKELAFLEGKSFNDYMNDMVIAQHYASLNRITMMSEIIKNMGWKVIDNFTTIHNYIDMDNMILRKGAISAQKDEIVIIPMNMRDGSIITRGKGNEDWNFSGPHGAGRIMSRRKAKEILKLEDFKNTMSNVWTSSVSENTLDEAPMVYKPMNEIIKNIGDSVEVLKVIKPLYNFKAN